MPGKKKILVIEDEISILKAIGEALKHEGFEVDQALDADQGMSRIVEAKPDLILLDLILPGKNGFELLKDLKATSQFASIPVIILTNLGDEEEIQQGLRMGAADYLIKADYDLAEIIKIIKKNLNKNGNIQSKAK